MRPTSGRSSLRNNRSFTVGSLIIACFVIAPGVRARGYQSVLFPQLSLQSSDDLSSEISTLTKRLRSSDEEERREATLKLSALLTPAAIPALTVGLSDTSERVRAAAATGLGYIGDPSSIATLVARIAQERKSPFMRKTIAYALGEFHTQEATAALVALLKDKDVEVRSAAAVALAQYNDATAIESLIAALNDKSDFVRAHAARALGVNGRSAAHAVSRLTRSLATDPDNEVRRQSAVALGLIGEPSAIAALERAEQSNDPYLSHAARNAIKMIQR